MELASSIGQASFEVDHGVCRSLRRCSVWHIGLQDAVIASARQRMIHPKSPTASILLELEEVFALHGRVCP